MKKNNYCKNLRERLAEGGILPLIGVYDQFSASITSKIFEGIFCSGYGFSASHYGLPDEGYICWSDMVNYVERMRSIIPNNHIVVDIDEGYGDPNIAAHVCKKLENVGASGIILEDQRRPKKCGHLPGKEIISKDDYMKRLELIRSNSDNLFIVSRTDANSFDEGIDRLKLYSEGKPDALMLEGISDVKQIVEIKKIKPKNCFLAVNLIAGGKTKNTSFSELQKYGVDIVIYSTPCLFLSHKAIKEGLENLKKNDGKFSKFNKGIDMFQNLSLMRGNTKISND